MLAGSWQVLNKKIQHQFISTLHESQAMATKLAKNCTETHHLAPVDSYCALCKTSTCKNCAQKAHYEHLESIQHRATDLVGMVNFLTKLKSVTTKALHTHTAVVRPLNVDTLSKDQEDTIRKSYSQFDAFVKQHKLALLWKIRLSRYVQKLRSMYDEAKAKRTKLEASKIEYAGRIKRLLEGISKGKYTPELIKLAGGEELEKQKKEMEGYKNLGEQLQKYVDQVKKLQTTESKYTQEKVKLRDICQLATEGLVGDKLILVRKNSPEFWTYCPDTKKSEKVRLTPTYTAPMNFGTAEIGKYLYIIGGNTVDAVGTNTFLETVTEIDLEKKTWKNLNSLQNRRRRAGVVTTKDRYIYVMGGDRDSDFLDSCEQFDVEKRVWTAFPSLTEAKTNVSAGVFGDRVIYLFGGYNKLSYDLGTIERFDTAIGKNWERVELSTPQYWVPIQNMGVVQISPNEMLVFGGMRVGKTTNQSLIYKVAEKKFEKTGDMMGSDTFLQTHPKVTSVFVYAFGCHHGDLHIFNTKSKVWTMIAQKDWAPKQAYLFAFDLLIEFMHDPFNYGSHNIRKQVYHYQCEPNYSQSELSRSPTLSLPPIASSEQYGEGGSLSISLLAFLLDRNTMSMSIFNR
eukprot:TRINITY_DN1328_c0_g1_i2.p1 TRINITY_DN1328_c0_g1~~TRINITY_DN1328_c0_g1_i2.p1  ORF type:complete len:624 (+),score=66.28 TRINITY_DN1328_c0_g1_i2:1654-3525(+)